MHTTLKENRIERKARLDAATVRAARSFLRLGKTTRYETLHSGEIPSRRFGCQFRIAKEALRPSSGGTADEVGS